MKKLGWALGLIAVMAIGSAMSTRLQGLRYDEHINKSWEIRTEQIKRHDMSYQQDAQEYELRTAAAIAERSFAKSDARRTTSLMGLGEFYQRRHAYGKAEGVFRKLCTGYGDAYAPHLANILTMEGRDHDAEVVYRRILATRERTASSGKFYETLLDLAACYARQGEWAHCAPLLRRACDIQRDKLVQAKRAALLVHGTSREAMLCKYALPQFYARELAHILTLHATALAHLNQPADAAQATAEASRLTAQYGHFAH